MPSVVISKTEYYRDYYIKNKARYKELYLFNKARKIEEEANKNLGAKKKRKTKEIELKGYDISLGSPHI